MPTPPTSLQTFLTRLEEAVPEPASFQGVIRDLDAEGLLETALAALKRRHPGTGREKGRGWGAIRARMDQAVARTRDQRMAQWQVDPLRRLIRVHFQVLGPATSLNPPGLIQAFARALQAAGLPLAMGMEKSPRPMITLAHPLPLGVEGHGEWVDITLRRPLESPLRDLPDTLAAHLPAGLSLLEAVEVPTVSSPVSELSIEARWSWPCPSPQIALAQQAFAAFRDASSWELEKPGKSEGQKVLKRQEVRHHVKEVAWEGPVLTLVTVLAGGLALNPQKLIAGVLGIEPAQIQGLARTEVRLGPDPRLQNTYKYETKLSNLYEDAVLLECGNGPALLDEEDDEPLHLGR